MDRELIPAIEIPPHSHESPRRPASVSASASASASMESIETPPPSRSSDIGPNSQTEIQPLTQNLKLLLQKLQWPQIHPTIEEEEADAFTKAINEYIRLVKQYPMFKCTAEKTFYGSELARSQVNSELEIYFRRYHTLLTVTNSQNADAIVEEVRNLISTHMDRHLLLISALEESKLQLAAKRKEFYDKLLAQVVGFGK